MCLSLSLYIYIYREREMQLNPGSRDSPRSAVSSLAIVYGVMLSYVNL